MSTTERLNFKSAGAARTNFGPKLVAERIIYTNGGYAIWQLAPDYFEVCNGNFVVACFYTEEEARDEIKRRLDARDEIADQMKIAMRSAS